MFSPRFSNSKFMPSTPTLKPASLATMAANPSSPEPIPELEHKNGQSPQPAVGVADVLQAIIAAGSNSNGPTTLSTPIMIECGERVMALGRKRMATMSGRNAFLYLKSKFGLLSTSSALYISAKFGGDKGFVEVDMDAWEELVPYMERLRIYS